MKIKRSIFSVGIYDPNHFDEWPFFFSLEGTFLSYKYRVCSHVKAAQFNTPEEARQFFHCWKNPRGYKLHLIESKEWVDTPDPIYAKEDPRSVLSDIIKNEHAYVSSTFTFWMNGDDLTRVWTKRTLRKHRHQILAYGFDIFKPCPKLQYHDFNDDEWHLKPRKLKSARPPF